MYGYYFLTYAITPSFKNRSPASPPAHSSLPHPDLPTYLPLALSCRVSRAPCTSSPTPRSRPHTWFPSQHPKASGWCSEVEMHTHNYVGKKELAQGPLQKKGAWGVTSKDARKRGTEMGGTDGDRAERQQGGRGAGTVFGVSRLLRGGYRVSIH